MMETNANSVTKRRYKIIRKIFLKEYDFYKRGFFPYKPSASFKELWQESESAAKAGDTI